MDVERGKAARAAAVRPVRPAGAARRRWPGDPRGRDPKEKGLWLPGAVIPNPLALSDIPFQPWAQALLETVRATSSSRTRAANRPASRVVPDAVRRRVRRAPELQRVYIFDIGGPHTYRTMYMDGRRHPRTRAHATTATRSAGGKATRWSSTRRASTRASGWIAPAAAHRRAAHHRTLHPHRCRTLKYELTDRRPRRLHQAVDRRDHAALGNRNRAVRIRVPGGELRARADGRPARQG